MKRIAGLIVIAALFVIGTGEARQQQEYSGNSEYSDNSGAFASSLAPYGEWVNTDFGSAWRPLHVDRHWRPYLYGRWAWTDYGWYWVSDEPFGWATFHYGRWTYDDYYGWIWVPGNTWGPSWVEWRYDDDYIGWAPLTPYAQFSFEAGIVWSNHWAAPVHYWNFLSCRRFTTARVSDYVEPVERARRIFGNTRGVEGIRTEHDRIINGGIDTRFVERRGNVRIPRVDVVDRKDASTERMIRDETRTRIETYRPNIQDLPRGGKEAQGDRPAVMPRRTETGRGDPRTGTGANMGEHGRIEPQRDALIERRNQARKFQEEEHARRQEQRMQNQQPTGRPERRMEQQERSGNQERRVQEQQQPRTQERQRVERGSQQSQRERGPVRAPQQQDGQRGRGRRPG